MEKHIAQAEIAPGQLVAFGTARAESDEQHAERHARGPWGRAGNLLLLESIWDDIRIPLLTLWLARFYSTGPQGTPPPALGDGPPSVLCRIFSSPRNPGEGPWGKRRGDVHQGDLSQRFGRKVGPIIHLDLTEE